MLNFNILWIMLSLAYVDWGGLYLKKKYAHWLMRNRYPPSLWGFGADQICSVSHTSNRNVSSLTLHFSNGWLNGTISSAKMFFYLLFMRISLSMWSWLLKWRTIHCFVLGFHFHFISITLPYLIIILMWNINLECGLWYIIKISHD